MFTNFIDSLKIMGLGMLGIFVVIIIITLFVMILEKLDTKDQKKG